MTLKSFLYHKDTWCCTSHRPSWKPPHGGAQASGSLSPPFRLPYDRHTVGQFRVKCGACCNEISKLPKQPHPPCCLSRRSNRLEGEGHTNSIQMSVCRMLNVFDSNSVECRAHSIRGTFEVHSIQLDSVHCASDPTRFDSIRKDKITKGWQVR